MKTVDLEKEFDKIANDVSMEIFRGKDTMIMVRKAMNDACFVILSEIKKIN